MKLKKAGFFILIILILDQVSKFYIKTNFQLGESVEVFNWFKILFVENKGMAWGAEIPGDNGKLILTIFRLIAIGGIGYWLWDSARKNAPKLLMISIALIFAGAFGNIIDSVFYGLLFDSSAGQIAQFLPESGAYGSLFHGKVVDMLYFPLYDGYLPQWLPIWGGQYFTFFEPVFNIADSAISVGVAVLIIFNKRVFPKSDHEKEKAENGDSK